MAGARSTIANTGETGATSPRVGRPGRRLFPRPGDGTVDRGALKAPAPWACGFESHPGHLAGFDDEENWTGEPPEGRHSRERANPGFWAGQRPLSITAAGVGLALLILALVLLL